jgi:hypothetical protein
MLLAERETREVGAEEKLCQLHILCLLPGRELAFRNDAPEILCLQVGVIAVVAYENAVHGRSLLESDPDAFVAFGGFAVQEFLDVCYMHDFV